MTIMTPVGSRFQDRSFGCALSDEMFGILDAATERLADYHIRTALGKYVPDVSIDNVRLLREGSVGLRVSISFSVVSTGEAAERSVSFSPTTSR